MNFKLLDQYYSLLKNSNFGLDLSPNAILNYFAYTCFKSNCEMKLFPSPPVVFIFATRQCNLNCNFCSIGNTKINSKKYDLTPIKYYKILNHSLLKKALLINFLGGEPLLNENICELISITKKQKKLSCIITNGIILKDKWNDLLKSQVDDIQISIYNNTFNIFGDTLKLINKEKQLNASYILLKSDLYNNQTIIEQVIDFINFSNFKSLKINLGIPNIFNNFINEHLSSDDTEKYEQLKNKILKKYKKMKIFFPKIPNYDKNFQKKCRIPWSILHVDAFGNYGFCCKHQPDINNTDNNIFTHNWEKVVNSNKFCKIRETLLSKDINVPKECINCYHLFGSYSSNI